MIKWIRNIVQGCTGFVKISKNGSYIGNKIEMLRKLEKQHHSYHSSHSSYTSPHGCLNGWSAIRRCQDPPWSPGSSSHRLPETWRRGGPLESTGTVEATTAQRRLRGLKRSSQSLAILWWILKALLPAPNSFNCLPAAKEEFPASCNSVAGYNNVQCMYKWSSLAPSEQE